MCLCCDVKCEIMRWNSLFMGSILHEYHYEPGKRDHIFTLSFPWLNFLFFSELTAKVVIFWLCVCCTMWIWRQGRWGVSLPWVAAGINRVTQVQGMTEFGLAQQLQTLALMSRLPLREVWIMSNEGELGWIKNIAPGIFANNLSATCHLGHCSALIWWNTLRINPWGHLW